MTLGSLDSKGIGRYAESTPVGSTFSGYMNEGLASVSDALPTLVAASATVRDTYWGTPVGSTAQLALQNRGATTIRLDKGWTERYFGLYNASTNPGGATVAGWYPIDGKLPKARLTKSTAQNTSGTINTNTALLFDLETYDDAGMHSVSSNTSRITIPTGAPGLYQVNASARLNSTSASFTIQFAKNGVALPETAQYALGNATLTPLVKISADIECVAGDYLEVLIASNTATQAITVGNCFFEAKLVGPR